MATYVNADHLVGSTDIRVAHRGGSRDYPEHSAQAYRRAYERGYRAFEVSINSSGVEGGSEWEFGGSELFLMHDWLLDRTSGTTDMAAQNTPWSVISELDILVPATAQPDATPQPYLTFDEYLDEFGEDVISFIDFKALPEADKLRAIEKINARGLMDRVVGKLVYGGPETYADFAVEAALWHQEGAPTWAAFYDNNVPDLVQLCALHDMVGLESASTFWPQLLAASVGKPKIAHIIIGQGGLNRSYVNGATGVMVSSPYAVSATPPGPPGPEPEPGPDRGPWSQPWDHVYVGEVSAKAVYVGPNLVWEPFEPSSPDPVDPDPEPVDPDPDPVDPDPEPWTLIYESTFATNDGWVARTESQANDDSYNTPDNVSYGSRGMVILGRRESLNGKPFTTADVLGQHVTVPNYFRADVVATLPTDYGMWPCPLWLRPLNGSVGEIDLSETWTYDWNGNPRSYSTIHDDYANKRHESGMLPYSALPNPDPAAPHTYTCIKTQGRMEFLIDGVRVYCWQAGASWSGTQRIGGTPSWYDSVMEVPGRTWYPRMTLQLGGPNTDDPLPEWQESEVIIHSLHIYRETE